MNNDTDNNQDYYNPFQDCSVKEFQDEARSRWGDTQAYKQSMAKVKKMTKAEMETYKENARILTQKIAEQMDKGVSNKEVQALIDEHYHSIQFFYDCPLDMYRNLGELYVNDARFAAHYDKFKPGLAVFMRDAIKVFSNQ